MNVTLKRGLERALSSTPVGRLAKHRIQGKTLILAYHGIVPDGPAPPGERSLFVSRSAFAAQLDAVSEIADVVALDRLDLATGLRPRVAITFDDAYRGAVDFGVREVIKRGFSATIFVAPSRLGGHTFWWDALAAGRPSLDEMVRDHALQKLAGCDERVREWATKIRMPLVNDLPAYARSATRAELETAVRFPGITVGSHSWSHPNLAALGTSELEGELEQARDWLAGAFGEKSIPWIAYPYGLDTGEVRRVAAKAGYAGGVRIGGGWHEPTEVLPLARPRLNVPGSLSTAGFRARIVGAVRS